MQNKSIFLYKIRKIIIDYFYSYFIKHNIIALYTLICYYVITNSNHKKLLGNNMDKNQVIKFLEQSIVIADSRIELKQYGDGSDEFMISLNSMYQVPRELYILDDKEFNFIKFAFSDIQKNENGFIDVKFSIKCKGFSLQGELMSDGITFIEGNVKIEELEINDKTIFSMSFEEM